MNMSKYTTELRWLIESLTADQSNLTISQRIAAAAPKIFNFEYPIWAENYKTTLETKILKHYFNKEIGMETVGLWKLYLEERMNLIMPYYNQLYETTTNNYDYLSNINLTEIFKSNKLNNEVADFTLTGKLSGITTDAGTDTINSSSNTTDNATSNTNATINKKNLESDLPQANYANLDYGTKLTEGEQTETQENTTNNTNNFSGESTNTRNNTTNASQDTSQTSKNILDANIIEDFTRTKKGAVGTKSLTELLMEYRKSLINIDKLIIDELYDLFMLIY
jgi:hypothetical protein